MARKKAKPFYHTAEYEIRKVLKESRGDSLMRKIRPAKVEYDKKSGLYKLWFTKKDEKLLQEKAKKLGMTVNSYIKMRVGKSLREVV